MCISKIKCPICCDLLKSIINSKYLNCTKCHKTIATYIDEIVYWSILINEKLINSDKIISRTTVKYLKSNDQIVSLDTFINLPESFEDFNKILRDLLKLAVYQ